MSSAAVAEPELSSNRSPTAGDGYVGRRIREFRRGHGLTLRQVAEAIGVTTAQLHRYEVGVTRVAASRLLAIAKVLRVVPAALLGDAAGHKLAAARAEVAEGPADLVELFSVFSSLPDDRLRKAVVLFARMLAASSSEHGPGSEPPAIL